MSTTHNPTKRPGRNDPCPCQSGKKYKRCCGCAVVAEATPLPAVPGHPSSLPPRIEDLRSPPVVGQTYLVPTVSDWDREPSPVLGPVHEDSQILKVPHYHFHYDIRFLTNERLRARCQMASQPIERLLADLASPEILAQSTLLLLVHALPGTEPTYRPLRCERPMPAYKTGLAGRWIEALEAAYKDARVGPAGRCPHRGLPLLSLPCTGGRRVCPGHGLCWRVTDGRLAPRSKQELALAHKMNALAGGPL